MKLADIKCGGLSLEEVHEQQSCSANVKCFHIITRCSGEIAIISPYHKTPLLLSFSRQSDLAFLPPLFEF
jgi:hypothetical protein